MPVVAGAFEDPAAADIPAGDSPAERAAHISRPRKPPAAQTEPPKRRRWRGLVIALVVLLVIGGGLGGTYAWAQTQYYVGRAGAEVAIYRGVNASFGPIKFSEVYENTDIKLSDLTPSARDQVVSGITAHDKADARRIVRRLHGEVKPDCPTTLPSGSTTPPTPSTTPSTTASTPATRSPSPRHRSTSGKISAPVTKVDNIAAPVVTPPATTPSDPVVTSGSAPSTGTTEQPCQ
jgi:protein phosphatase